MSAAAAHKFAPATAVSPTVRADLRTGVAAAGRVDVRGLDMDQWIAALTAARIAWRADRHAAPLSAPAPAFLFEAGAASRLDALLRGADFAKRSVTIEIDEADLLLAGEAGFAAIERLRARSWGVALVCDAACAMPLGKRLRGALTEIIADAPEALSPALALSDAAAPLLKRVRAAGNAGLAVTARQVKSPAHAGMLIALGFDRGEYVR